MPRDHRFGELLATYRARKPSLSQKRLAELTGFDNAILVRMSQGKKDLTGPSGRDRIIRLLGTLRDEGVGLTLDEANTLLASADLPPLYAGLPAEAVLLKRLDAPPKLHPTAVEIQHTNLLIALTSFIGRDKDMGRLVALIRENRLVTLTGAGGIGKTRLALEAARQFITPQGSSSDFADGVWLTEFAALSDPALVPQTVSSALKLPERANQSYNDLLVGHLQRRQVLLVLDNCEHLIAACAELAEYLLQRCPRLRIVATSREAMRIAGEVVYQVAPLETPNPAQTGVEHILRYPSAQLFVARAAMNFADGEMDLTPSRLQFIATVCHHLDGMPLALELGAALTRTLTVEEIAKRLEDRFALLVSGTRTAIPRHRTLRSAIDWSYSLLSPAEKNLLASLSMFAGGWMTDAAEAVCGVGADSTGQTEPGVNVLALLGELVNKSLVVAERRATHTRYRMLETIREFALGKFSELGVDEQKVLQQRHLHFLVQLHERPWPEAVDERGDWLERLQAERENVRWALDWALHHKQILDTQRLVVAAAGLWWARAHFTESYTQLHKVLAQCDPTERTSLRVALLIYTGIIHWQYEQDSLPLLNEALEIATELNDTGQIVHALVRLGNEAWYRRDHVTERVYYLRALAIWEQANDQRGIATIKEILGDNSLDLGQIDAARTYYEESLRLWKSLGLEMYSALPLKGLGQISLAEGNHEQALGLFKDSLRRVIESGITFAVPHGLSRIAGVAIARGDMLFAVRLFGAEDALFEAQGSHTQSVRDVYEEREREIVRSTLDEHSFALAYAEGRKMTEQEGIAYALSL